MNLRRSSCSDGATTAIAEPDPTGDATTGAFIAEETTAISDPIVDNGAYNEITVVGIPVRTDMPSSGRDRHRGRDAAAGGRLRKPLRASDSSGLTDGHLIHFGMGI